MLITHPHLAPWLRKSGSINPRPQYAFMACIGTTFTSPILKRNIARANSDAFHFCFLYRMRQEFSKQPSVVKHRVSGGFCGTLYVIPAFTERGEKYVNGLIYMHIAAKHKVVTFHCVISLFLTSDCSSD